MTLDANESLEPGSSVGSTLDAGDGADAIANANSSDATGEMDDLDTLSVVRDAVAKEVETDDPPASPAGSDEDGQTTDDPKETAQDDENYSDVPFHKHPRFQHVLRRMKTAEVDAVQYRNVQTFLDQNGLAAEEAADALVIAGLMKTNPVEAWGKLKPVVQRLLQAVGEVLPPELAQRVERGEMSREVALELSRKEAAVRGVQAQQTFAQQRAAQEQQQRVAAARQDAVASWESDRRTKDPNFDAKLPMLMDVVAGLQRRDGQPVDAQGVRDQLNAAYKIVNERYAPPAPKPQRRPVSGGTVAGSPAPEATSTLEIIRRARAG